MKKILFTICILALVSLSAQTGNVGINTATPIETLDVNGKTYAKDLYLNSPGEPQEEGGSFLASGNVSGNTAMQTYTSSKKLLNYINLTLNNVSNDGVTDFNTRISTSEFILVVHNYSFAQADGSNLVSLSNATANSQSSPDIASFKGADGFWHIRARFPNSKFVKVSGASTDNPNASDRFRINLYMMAYRYLITKQNINDQSVDLEGTNGSGDSIPKPTGF